MNKKFSPSRLIEARIEKEMTQLALSENTGLSRMTISKLEKGLISSPSAETIMSLSCALQKPSVYFLSDVSITLKNMTQPLFRSHKSKSKNDNLRSMIKLKHAELMIQYLYQFIKPRFNEFEKIFYEDDVMALTDMEIEAIALNTRELLGADTGPLLQLITILENHGVICIKTDLPKKIDSLSVSFQLPEINGETALILFNSDLNYYRQRFSIAHELGHIILHRYSEPSDNDEEMQLLEEQANKFASAFLMPATSFINSIQTQTLSGALILKDFWKISAAAAIRRMMDLEVIDSGKYKYMQIEISRKGWKKKEPMDDSMQPETPYYMEKAFGFLLSNKYATPESIREYCGFDNKEITEYISNRNYFYPVLPDSSFIKRTV